ncbi:hypothetical protein [Streptococcus pluranimalium]|uniref:Uncharacterized protein n=1 Tax=Streptococcus pluranimalium TaxID=82348 RepID=A0A2L0D6C0_9STRE|nr:hypothetical protein [Streptococcus pluranimalium]AUW97393.1 hypothetical protein C0J00_09920 [Streptococcus pluranimalium]
MEKLDDLQRALRKKQLELEQLEDDYYNHSNSISEQFCELDSRRSELEALLQETYEATNYSLRQDDVINEESFHLMNQIIESFQIELDTEYDNERRNLLDLEEERKQTYVKERYAIEQTLEEIQKEKRQL